MRVGLFRQHVELVGQPAFAELHGFLSCLVEEICGLLEILLDIVAAIHVNLSHTRKYDVGRVAFSGDIMPETGSIASLVISMLLA